MSRHSRTLLGLLAALLLMLLAVACGGGEDGDTGASGDTGAGATGEQVSGNVSVMGIWTGEEQKKFQAVIDAFNEQQPDVTRGALLPLLDGLVAQVHGLATGQHFFDGRSSQDAIDHQAESAFTVMPHTIDNRFGKARIFHVRQSH